MAVKCCSPKRPATSWPTTCRSTHRCATLVSISSRTCAGPFESSSSTSMVCHPISPISGRSHPTTSHRPQVRRRTEACRFSMAATRGCSSAARTRLHGWSMRSHRGHCWPSLVRRAAASPRSCARALYRAFRPTSVLTGRSTCSRRVPIRSRASPRHSIWTDRSRRPHCWRTICGATRGVSGCTSTECSHPHAIRAEAGADAADES